MGYNADIEKQFKYAIVVVMSTEKRVETEIMAFQHLTITNVLRSPFPVEGELLHLAN